MKRSNFNTGENVYIIAEIGNNHEGDLSLAKEMINLALECGANAVKFQTIVPELLVTSTDKNRINQLKKFQISYEGFEELSNYAMKSGIDFLSTPFDIESAFFLEDKVAAYKIASSDNNFYPLLKVLANTGKPLIMSTGATSFKEIKSSINYISKIWKNNAVEGDLSILHCVSNYPTLIENANLRSIKYLQDHLSLNIGYSDHTLGIDACLAAVSMGATIIEKHFTIDKYYSEFRDHQISADPKELKILVDKIRSLEIMLGTYKKEVLQSESDIKTAIRRSLAAKTDLPENSLISENNIIWVRPGNGIPIGKEYLLIGKKTNRIINKGELITQKDVK